MAKAAILALVVRVSDVKGRDKKGDRFISPDEQIRDGTAYAKAREFEVSVMKPMDLNVSHTRPLDERPAMSRALALVEAGKLAGIVLSSQDRLGTLAITRELKARLLTAGAVLLVADNPGAEVLDAKGYGKLPTEYIALLHEAQREEIGLRWAKARRNAVERGIHPSTYAPIGYGRNDVEPRVTGAARASLSPEERWADPVVGQLVPSEHAEHIRALFKLRAAGGSWNECAQLMESRGVPNRKGEPFWLISATQAIIRNPAYRGEAYLRSKGKQAGDFVNPDAHEPVVDAVLWRQAQPKEGKPRRSADGALLSGVLRCASCGRRLSPSGHYYRCRPRMVTGPACPAPANAPTVEVEALVTRDFLSAIAYRPAAPTPPDLTPFEQAVALAKAKLADWQEAALAGDVDPGKFAPVLAAREAELEQAQERLAEARRSAGLDIERVTLAERWDTLTVAERRRALQAFGLTVHVRRKQGWVEVPDEIGPGGVELGEPTRRKETLADRVFLTFDAQQYRTAATGGDFEPEIVVEHVFEDEAVVT